MSSSARNILILDYDGTLAPFHVDPSKAQPYPGVREFLSRIQESGGEIFLVTGREPEEVRDLLDLPLSAEIWGCHGAVRLFPDGTREMRDVPVERLVLLDEAERVARELQMGRIERKTTSVAVHWRGENDEAEARIRRAVSDAWGRMGHPGFSLEKFDGGVELRMEGFDKGQAVNRIMENFTQQDYAVYLGDDQTDEDGFAAIRKLGGLGILVRQKCRDTRAGLWLKPPQGLEAFLELWLSGISERKEIFNA
jgi:trehalose-phosphatase